MEGERIERRIVGLSELIELWEEKLFDIDSALVLATDPSLIFKYTKDAESAQGKIAELEDKVADLKRRLAPITAPSGPEPTDGEELSISVRCHMSHVPTGYYHLLDVNENPLASYEIDNRTSHSWEFRATSQIVRYSDPAVRQFKVEPESSIVVGQLPILVSAQVHTLNELTAATLRTHLQDIEGGKSWENAYALKLHARNTALLAMYDEAAGEWRDLSRFLAAWVTPNAPEVQRFLDKVRAHHPKKALVGYQGAATPAEQAVVVTNQVRAIYNALQEAGLGYINSFINFGMEPGKAMQRVRLPHQSLEGKGANCIDGAVLFASLMMAISLHPALMLVPGHAFVGWETWEDSEEFECLETTLVGSAPFEDALAAGNAKYRARLEKGDLGRPISDRKGFLVRIELKEAREMGMFPQTIKVAEP